MKSSFLILQVVCLLIISRPVSSRPDGAPSSACTEMNPFHNGAPPTRTPCPFIITATVPCFQPGQRILLFLRDPLGDVFKGLMVQARLRGDAKPQSVGSFDLNGNKDLKFLNCFGTDSDTITHLNAELKQYKEFGWTAPAVFPGESVDFTYTIVKSFTIFWVQQVFNLPICAPVDNFTKVPETSDNPLLQVSLVNDQPNTQSYQMNDGTVQATTNLEITLLDVSSGSPLANGTVEMESIQSDNSSPGSYNEIVSSTIKMTTTEKSDATVGDFNQTNQDFHTPLPNANSSGAVSSQIFRTVESLINNSNTSNPRETNQGFPTFSGISTILPNLASNQSTFTIIDLEQTKQYISFSPVINSSLSKTDTISILRTQEAGLNASATVLPQTVAMFSNGTQADREFSVLVETLSSNTESNPAPKSSSLLSQLVPTTTIPVQVGQCIDSGSQCKTLNVNKCYNHVIKAKCCLSCAKLQSTNIEGCEYGDKISICGFYRQSTSNFCKYYKEECCASCRAFA